MLTHRCPWCGEKISFHFPFRKLIWKYVMPYRCRSCNRAYTLYQVTPMTVILLILLVLIGYGIALGLENDKVHPHLYWFLGALGIFDIILLYIKFLQIPYCRANKKGEPITNYKMIQKVCIHWESKAKGRVPYVHQILNGEIFPACFMDENGVPISRALCVVLDNIKWLGSRNCKCTIQFVLDDIKSETYFQKGNRLYLYYDYKKIAEGVVE